MTEAPVDTCNCKPSKQYNVFKLKCQAFFSMELLPQQKQITHQLLTQGKTFSVNLKNDKVVTLLRKFEKML